MSLYVYAYIDAIDRSKMWRLDGYSWTEVRKKADMDRYGYITHSTCMRVFNNTGKAILYVILSEARRLERHR